VKESAILSNKLIRHLRNLNVTYTFNEENLRQRLQKVIDDQLMFVTLEDAKKHTFYEKFA